MAALHDEDRQGLAAALLVELGELAAELSGLSTNAQKTATAGDIDALSDVCEEMLASHVRFAERYRTLLVVRVRPSRATRTVPGMQSPSL